MDSLFVTGTDTGVGKTHVAAGIAITLRMMGIDVGVMKPFAAGDAQKSGFKSQDADILRRAARSDDPESLINPQFFPIQASPYTARTNLGMNPDVGAVTSSYKRLAKIHDTVVVEGIGGVMTPILEEYFVANLIAEMGIPAVVVAGSKVGTINHTVMTCMACQRYGVSVKGIIINDFAGGYPASDLSRDLEALTGIRVLGSVPFTEDMADDDDDDDAIYETFRKSIDVRGIIQDNNAPSSSPSGV